MLITLPIFLYNFHQVHASSCNCIVVLASSVCSVGTAWLNFCAQGAEQLLSQRSMHGISAVAAVTQSAAAAGMRDAVQRDAARAARDGGRGAEGDCGPRHVHSASAAIRQCRCVAEHVDMHIMARLATGP